MVAIHLLKTADVPAVPPGIEIKADYGMISIRTGDGKTVWGTHISIEGTEEAVLDWLQPLDGFWVGVGAPMMQEFEIAHVRDE